MKFNELSTIWNSDDMELDRSITINKKLVKEIGLSKVKSRLYEIKWTGIFEIVVGFIFINFLVSFIVNNISEFILFISGVVLLAISLFSMILEIKKLALLYTMDSKSPVSEAQRKLARLKYLEVMDVYSLYIIIPLFSGPFLIVAAKAFLNIDLYSIGATWLMYHTFGSVFIAAILVFFLRKFPNRKLQESIAFLNELKENENND